MAPTIEIGRMVKLMQDSNSNLYILSRISTVSGQGMDFPSIVGKPEDMDYLGDAKYEREFDITIPVSSIQVERSETSGILGRIGGSENAKARYSDVTDQHLRNNIQTILNSCRQYLAYNIPLSVEETTRAAIQNLNTNDFIVGFYAKLDDEESISVLLPTIFQKSGNNNAYAKSIITIPMEFYAIKKRIA